MTGRDSSLYVRRAIVTDLRATPGMSARVYGPAPPANPTWPFTRVAVDGSEPFTAQCLRGSIVTITVHNFAKGADEQVVTEMNAATAARLDGRRYDLTDAPYSAHLCNIRWLRSQVIRDTPEASDWHGIVSFRALVSS